MRYVLKLKQKVGKLYIFCSVTYLHVVPNISDTYNGGSAIITPERNGALKRCFVYCLLFVRATVQFIGISYYLS